MSKEIEEMRLHKAKKKRLTDKLGQLSKQIENDGYAYILVVSDLKSPLRGVCAGGPADYLSSMVTVSVEYVTKLMAKDLLRRREAMKSAGIEEDNVDLREHHDS